MESLKKINKKNIFTEIKTKILNNYQCKITLIAFLSLFIGLFISGIVSYNSIQDFSDDAAEEMKRGLSSVNNEYINNYINITSQLIESKIKKFVDEQDMLAQMFQKVIDNEDEFEPLIFKPLIKDISNIPYFYKYGYDKLWIYFSGESNGSFMGATPWKDVGAPLNETYPKHPYEPNWKALNPRLVGDWERQIGENIRHSKDLASLAIIKSPAQDCGTGNIIMTIRHPIWNRDRTKFKGAISIDAKIEEVIGYVKNIKLAHTGFAYIAQSNGNVFAINNEGARVLGLKDGKDVIVEDETGTGYNLINRFLKESTCEGVQGIILPKENKIVKNEISIHGEKYITIQKNLKGLNTWDENKGFHTESWTLGFVIPKDEVFNSYYSATNKIDHSRNVIMLKQFLIFVLLTLLICVFICFIIKKVTSNLRRLELITVEVMNENYDVNVDIKSNDEIGRIAKTIKNMSIKIKSAFQQLSIQNRILENEIAEREKKERQIKYLENYDILTNLPKEDVFLNSLEKHIENTEGNSSYKAIMMIGLDDFRKVNEVLGHKGGSEVLKIVSSRLESIIGDGGIVARISGDEFAILYNNISSVEEVAPRVENIMTTLSLGYHVLNKQIFITTSIGISLYPSDSIIPSELLEFASSALIHTKEKSKGSYQFYDVEMNKSAQERNKMITALRYGIENDEFELYYQPQFNLDTKKLTGMEALIRWNSSILGKVMPSSFIPLAEDTSLILELGEWIIRTACTQNKKWHDEGYDSLVVSVNLSPIQFNQKNFVENMKNILEETKLLPQFLELEVTERLLINDTKHVVKILHELRKLGIKISIDDFGTGYSSLSYIRDLPVDKLKIDRSFIKDIPNKDDGSIANIIIELGKNLNLKINAEGVETKEQEDFLLRRKCHEVQGYYYSHPLRVNEFTLKLREGFNV